MCNAQKPISPWTVMIKGLLLFLVVNFLFVLPCNLGLPTLSALKDLLILDVTLEYELDMMCCQGYS